MKTEYTAWAVQVLRDGKWDFFQSGCDWPILFSARSGARAWARGEPQKTRVRKVKVTVEEV